VKSMNIKYKTLRDGDVIIVCDWFVINRLIGWIRSQVLLVCSGLYFHH
jgi:hypothetical protein